MKIIDSTKQELIYRFLSLLLSSIFFANIPILLFVVYMHHHSFFSYDFFTDGVFGIKTIFIVTFIFLCTCSVCFLGSLYFFINKAIPKQARKRNFVAPQKRIVVTSFVFNLLIITLTIININTSLEKAKFILLVMAIGALIVIHVSFLINAKSKYQFYSLASVFISFVLIIVISSATSVKVLSMQLKQFGIGGKITVEIESVRDKDKILGELLLTTPKHFYVILSGEKRVSTIDRNKYGVITIKNN